MHGGFDEFVKEVEPVLRRALTGCMPRDQVHDGLAEAFAHAWEHWDEMAEVERPRRHHQPPETVIGVPFNLVSPVGGPDDGGGTG